MSSFQVQQQHLLRGNQAQQTCLPGQTSISVPLYNNPVVFSQAHPITVAAQMPTDGSERQPQSDYSQDRSLRYDRSPAGTILTAAAENSDTWAAGRAGTSGLRAAVVSGCHSRDIRTFPPAEICVSGEHSVRAGRVLCPPCPALRGLKSFSLRISINCPGSSVTFGHLLLSEGVNRKNEQGQAFPNLCLLALKLQSVFSPARTSAVAKAFFFYTVLETLYKTHTTAPNYSTTFPGGICRQFLQDPAVLKYCVRKQDKP